MEPNETENPPSDQAKTQTTSVTLSDGRKATIKRAKGYDLRNARRIAQGDDIEFGMALAALMTSIDGRPLVYEDFLDLDLTDCYAIVNAYNALMGN